MIVSGTVSFFTMPLLKFSIIIPTRNRHQLLADLLMQLVELEYPHDCFEVIVVDNAPTDTLTEQLVHTLHRQQPKLRLSYLQTSQMGASVARNVGYSQVKYARVIFLDDDVCITPQLLRGYNTAWKKYPSAKIIGGKVEVTFQDGSPLTPDQQQIVHGPDAWCFGATICPPHDEVLHLGGAVVSANMSVRKESEKRGIFSLDLGKPFSDVFQFGSEDYELCQRQILSEKKVVFCADLDLVVKNRVTPQRFTKQYLDSRYWLHGMELAVIEKKLRILFPDSFSIYRGFLLWDLTHWPNIVRVLKRFTTHQREWIRLFSYLYNGKYLQ